MVDSSKTPFEQPQDENVLEVKPGELASTDEIYWKALTPMKMAVVLEKYPEEKFIIGKH